MDSIKFKLASVALLILGEVLSVYTEMAAASAHAGQSTDSSSIFAKSSVLMAIAGALLIGGYMIGYSAFKNIWIVSVVSVTSILIVEPVLAYTICRELPTRGALVGFVLGSGGFLATLFYK